MITLAQLLEHDGDEDDADEFIGDEGGETPSMRFGIGGDVGATTGAMNSSVDYTIDEISMKLSELLDIPTALWMEHAVLLDEDSRALAKKMGYKSIGYGRWIDETGKVRARTIKGKLWHLAEELPEEEDRPAHLKEPVLDRTVTTGALPNNFENAELEEKRDYKREYALYHAKPEQKKRRAQRNGARRKMERLGHVKKGDGQDVHHSNRNTADNSSKNLKIMPKSKNRSLK